MGIQFNFNTDEVSPADVAVLAAVVGALGGEAPAAAAPAAKKASPAPAKRAQPKPAEPEPEPEPEDNDEDLIGGGDEVDRDTVAEFAGNLVSDGKAAIVKKALAKLGVKRVSEVDDSDLASFYADLQG